MYAISVFFFNVKIKTHIYRLVSSCCYQLRRMRSVRRSLPTTKAITLINSFVISMVDYCNSLFVGLTAYQTNRIQAVLTDAARLIFGVPRGDHVTLILRERLHWLRAPQGMEFKVRHTIIYCYRTSFVEQFSNYCSSIAMGRPF